MGEASLAIFTVPSSRVTQGGELHNFSLPSLLSQKHHKILFHAKLYSVGKISLPEIFPCSRSVGFIQPAGHSYMLPSGAESLQCCSLQCPGQEMSRRGSQRSCSLEAGTDPTTSSSPLRASAAQEDSSARLAPTWARAGGSGRPSSAPPWDTCTTLLKTLIYSWAAPQTPVILLFVQTERGQLLHPPVFSLGQKTVFSQAA